MTYRALKKITKNYDTKFTKESSTREMHLTFGNCDIHIIEQQYGVVHSPQVEIVTSKCTYCISLNDLIHKIDPDANTTENSLF
jgi:hypothetical protein